MLSLLVFSWVQVIVIEKGCVMEQGTHSELLARDGVYKQLVMRQLMAGEERGGEKLGNLSVKDPADSAVTVF